MICNIAGDNGFPALVYTHTHSCANTSVKYAYIFTHTVHHYHELTAGRAQLSKNKSNIGLECF